MYSYQHYFDLGIISSRIAAAKDFSEQDKELEYSNLKRVLNSLNIDVPSFDESFNIINYADHFKPPDKTLKQSLYRMGTLSFALFLLDDEQHLAAEKEFLSLFDVIGIDESIGEEYLANLKKKPKREAFTLFLKSMIPILEDLNIDIDSVGALSVENVKTILERLKEMRNFIENDFVKMLSEGFVTLDGYNAIGEKAKTTRHEIDIIIYDEYAELFDNIGKNLIDYYYYFKTKVEQANKTPNEKEAILIHAKKDLDKLITKCNKMIQQYRIKLLDIIKVAEEQDTKEGAKESTLILDINIFRKEFKESHSTEWYFNDIENDLNEISVCLGNNCYRATLALAGRVLELTLKIFCAKNQIEVEGQRIMVGQILGLIRASGIYVDPSTENIWNLINQQRIIGVHQKSSVPIPSASQANMVCYALLDTMRRVLHN
jgi:hypothetical protein